MLPEPERLHEHVRSYGGRWIFPPAADGNWGVRRVANGSLQVIWKCNWCGLKTTPVPQRLVTEHGISIHELPIVEDYAGLYARCIVRGCGSDEVEWNHIAPKGIFGEDEAEDWGQVAMCRRHHEEWGNRVTPQLNPPRKPAA